MLGKAAINYMLNSLNVSPEVSFSTILDDNYITYEYSALKEYAINNSDKEVISTPNVNISDNNVTWLEQMAGNLYDLYLKDNNNKSIKETAYDCIFKFEDKYLIIKNYLEKLYNQHGIIDQNMSLAQYTRYVNFKTVYEAIDEMTR